VIAGLTIEPFGHLQTLWLTMFIFGNVFAIFWLARAFLNAHPHIAYQVRCALAKIGLGGRRKSKQAGGAADADAAEAAAAAAADRKTAARSVTANVTAAAAAGHAGIELSPSVGPARVASAVSGASSQRHHHHAQPIICTPSMEVHTDSFAGSPSAASGAAAAAAAAGGVALVGGRSADGSCSSCSSDDEGLKLPVQLQWVNMCYSVKAAAGSKHIIQVGTVRM
jgi:hypothetical protein